jgi:hypothetical protein
MMIDTYLVMGRDFEPQKEDIEGYLSVLDKDLDGKVGIEDIKSYLAKINKIEI